MCPGREKGHEVHQALREAMGEHGTLSRPWVSLALSPVNIDEDGNYLMPECLWWFRTQ